MTRKKELYRHISYKDIRILASPGSQPISPSAVPDPDPSPTPSPTPGPTPSRSPSSSPRHNPARKKSSRRHQSSQKILISNLEQMDVPIPAENTPVRRKKRPESARCDTQPVEDITQSTGRLPLVQSSRTSLRKALDTARPRTLRERLRIQERPVQIQVREKQPTNSTSMFPPSLRPALNPNPNPIQTQTQIQTPPLKYPCQCCVENTSSQCLIC